MDRPVIFLSAVSAEFCELRQLLHDSFKTHFHVITQDDTLHKFPGGDVRQLLSDAIDGSHAVLHLAGAGFGSTAAAPFPEMPGFLCSWTQYEYYYAHTFDTDPVHRKQIFAIVCGPTLRSPTFTEKDDATLTASQKAPLQEAHCQRIFSGKFDATPLASIPRTANHREPINDNAAALRAAIDICAQLATRQPAFQSACALVEVSLQDQLQPLLQGQQEIKRDTTHLRRALPWLAAVLAVTAVIVLWVKMTTDRTSGDVNTVIAKVDDQSRKLDDQRNLLKTAVAQLEQLTEEKARLGIKITDLPREIVEKELAARVGISAVELRLNIEAGKKSQDALTRANANLLAGKLADAHTAAREVRDAEAPAIQRIIQSHQVDGQAYFQELKYHEALESYNQAAALVVKDIDPIAWAEAQEDVTFIQLHLAEYEQAEPILRELIRLREHHLGHTHPKLATSLNNLAYLLQTTHHPTEAEPLMRRALQIDEAAYGKDHPTVARDLNNLSQLLKDTNHSAEAERLIRRALNISEAAYGKDHPEVALNLSNLAQILEDTNRLAEAELIMRQVIQIDEVVYSNEHPDFATDLNNLGQLLKKTNRLAEAEPLFRQALQIDEAAYGNVHPNVARDLNNLARLLQDTNRLAEAEPLMHRALHIFETAYGKDHPDVAIALTSMADLFKETGRYAEAEPLMRRAVQIDEVAYGKDHPQVANSLSTLAEYLQGTKRPTEAEPLMRRALQIDEAAYGKDHPSVARDLNNLAQPLQDKNCLAEAEQLMRRALQIDEATYGRDHPNVGRDLNNLAQLLQTADRLAEAEPLSRRAVGVLLRFQARTGHRNPNILGFLSNYLGIARALKLSDGEAYSHLDSERDQAGLEPAAFESLWAAILAAYGVGPFLVTVDEAVAGGQGIGLGIQPGDVILSYHGKSITSIVQLIQLAGEVKEEAISLEILRGKETLKFTAKPGALGLKIQNVIPPAPAE